MRTSTVWKLLAGALLLGAVWFYLGRGPDELGRWKAAAAARGEKLSLKELVAPVTSETLSVMGRLTGAVSRLQVSAADPSIISPMSASTPGFAKVAWAQDSLEVAQSRTVNWADFAVQMRQNAEGLEEIRAVLRNPPRSPSYDMLDPVGPSGPPLVAKRRAAYWLWGATADALHRGELDEALTNLHAMFAFTRMNDEESLLVNQMVLVAVAGLAMGATWEALQAPGWDESRLARLQQDWQQVALLSRLERTLQVERASGLAWFDYARTNRQGASRALRGSIGINSTDNLAQVFNKDVYLPVWQNTWSKHDELVYLKGTEKVLEAIRKAGASRSNADARKLLAGWTQQSFLDQFRFPLSDALVPNWGKALPSVMRHETRRQLVVTALAIKRYQLKHGEPPEGLQQLVPEFLRELPCDYMVGTILLYERKPEGAFILYSVGENGQDEHALGDDIVWPRAEMNSLNR